MNNTTSNPQAIAPSSNIDYSEVRLPYSKVMRDNYVRHTQYMLDGQILASVNEILASENHQNKIAKGGMNSDTAKACQKLYASALRTPARNPMGAKMLLLSERTDSYITLNKREEARRKHNFIASQLRKIEMPKQFDLRIASRFFACIIILLAAAMFTFLLVL
jgi:hypothetical protein